MKLEIATEQDNERLIEFYRRFTMGGPVEIKHQRMKDFFLPYKIQGHSHITFKLEEENDIQGMASFVVNRGLINKTPHNFGFGRDLRISSNRRAVLSWGQHFLPIMRDVKSTFDIDYLFTVLSSSEVEALNAFVRPRVLKRPLPRYYLYRRFNLVSLHGQFPWSKNPLPHLRIKRGSTNNVGALVQYLIKKSLQKDLSPFIDQNSFEEYLNRHPGLKLEDFLIAYDGADEIIGCVAPWSAENVIEMIPLKYSLVAHNFRQFLKFGQLFGWSRALTKPASRLKTEDNFHFRYLNCLFANNEDIFESLLYAAFQESRPDEFLVYTHVRTDFQFRKPLSWICARIPFVLYCLVPPDEEPPFFLNPKYDRSIFLDPFFV